MVTKPCDQDGGQPVRYIAEMHLAASIVVVISLSNKLRLI
jgi:hypothetical protein